MKMKDIFLLYLRSPLNIVMAGLCAGAAAFSIIFLGAPILPVLTTAFWAWLLISAISITSRRGVKSIVAEKDRNLLADMSEKIEAAVGLRKKIEFLRLPDTPVRNAVKRLLYVSGTYIEVCRKQSSYSPHANERLEDSLSLLTDYMKELNEQAAEKHFGVSDESPFQDLDDRMSAALDENSRVIVQKTRELEGGLDAEDRMDIREDLS